MDHPRIRGEHDPRRRGPPATGRIIPAYAGSTERRTHRPSPLTDHPRIRGEHFAIARFAATHQGSSPHTRGARQPAGDGHKIPRIIPAYAGSTSSYPTCELPRTDHPRIRGEHASPAPPPDGGPGSSPHTRGAPSSSHTFVPHSGIIPAYAGSTASRKRGKPESSDHPRIRGEHLSGLYTGDGQFGSSPHTRGAPPEFEVARHCAQDHPRIRGEHILRRLRVAEALGSSPHTRGAPPM